jgi:hypothetical protein
MGNERRVIVGQHGAVALDEIQEVRHLLQVGWNVRVVAREVDVVELDVNNVLDGTIAGTELTSARRVRDTERRQRDYLPPWPYSAQSNYQQGSCEQALNEPMMACALDMHLPFLLFELYPYTRSWYTHGHGNE